MLFDACNILFGENVTQAEITAWEESVCGETQFSIFAQFWFFLKNLFNPEIWDFSF